jgi:hypothetical protein
VVIDVYRSAVPACCRALLSADTASMVLCGNYTYCKGAILLTILSNHHLQKQISLNLLQQVIA